MKKCKKAIMVSALFALMGVGGSVLAAETEEEAVNTMEQCQIFRAYADSRLREFIQHGGVAGEIAGKELMRRDPNLTAQDMQKIVIGLKAGMTPDDVITVMGKPEKVTKTGPKGGDGEQWRYKMPQGKAKFLMFEGGVLKQWKE